MSEKISQNSLENYFGQQRARGGRNVHTNLVCVQYAAALPILKSVALNPVRGNCRRKRLTYDKEKESDDKRLPKRQHKRNRNNSI